MTHFISISAKETDRVREVLRQYQCVDELRKVVLNTIGLMNKTYLVNTKTQRFVLRESGKLIEPAHLMLEVETLRFLEEKKFELSPRLISNIHGEYVTKSNGRNYQLQNFLPGEARFTMDNVEGFEGAVLRDYFRVVAEFTKTVRDFVPSEEYPYEPIGHAPIYLIENLDIIIKNFPLSPGKFLVSEHRNAIVDLASQTQKELTLLEYDALPKQLMHLDIHPGNVHFLGDRVTGLFDYDWLAFDCRIADLAMSLAQSCHSRRGGLLVKAKVIEGLTAYRLAYGASEFEPEFETRLIQSAVQASVLSMTDWVLSWYPSNKDHPKAMSILNHWINLCCTSDFRSLFI